MLEHSLGRKAKLEMLPLQAGDVPDTEADISELESTLGYAPEVSIEAGIPRFVNWYLEFYEFPRG